ncbi:tyrosine-type recombinase/integrase [Sessilibacter corallicola]|uniref:tyrosine-type recombinase/integrase n=1 Tax=Sessilibacter corallicola TaxID=2904075 RepID=UPI001E60AAA4|nr:tyrosine-type recombinase/integrase [Sessilibacter corallicola]MCE2027498.1 tyrosine-type recombinase/integrase [Sessilibacter corallicola]
MNLQKACAEFLDYSTYVKKLSHHSIRAYHRDLATFQEILGPRKLIKRIDRNSIKKYVDASFAKDMTPLTMKRRLACLKTFFKWLENEEVIETSPFHKLDLKIRIPAKLPRNLSTNELNKILRVASKNLGLLRKTSYETREFKKISKSNINDLTTLISIELLFTTGIRVAELTGISLSDIYLNERYIHIRGKGQRERRVFITDNSIYNLIKSYIHYRTVTNPEHDTLLVNSIGRPATTQTVRIWLKNISKKAKINKIATPHMYRHSTATELLSAGVDIVYVQKLLGHQSISTTQIYTHVNHDEVYRNVVKANIREEIL